MGTKIDLEQLVKEIRELTPQQKLFVVLKRELSKLKYWRNRPRGRYAK
jgi:hypothetical protein